MRIAASGAVTIPGDLTVDTSTLKVDSANNRVGIGTASPSDKLEVVFGTNGYITATNSTDTNTGVKMSNTGRSYGIFTDGGSGASNSLRFFDFTASAERMRLDASGNLGLGVTPSAKLHVKGSGELIRMESTAATGLNFLQWYDSGDRKGYFGYVSSGNNDLYLFNEESGASIIFGAAATERARIDASGNLGVGVTPSHILDVGANNSTPKTIALRYSTLPLYLSSTFDGTDGLNTLSINNNNTSNGSASWASAANSVYSSAAIQVTCNTSGGTVRFLTSAATNTAPTERARITSGGYFKASNTGTYNNATGTFSEISNNGAGSNAVWLTHTSASDPYGPYINFSAAAPDNNTNYFIACVDNVATRMIVYSDGDILNHDGTYGTLPSERRFKQDITDANTQWDDIKNIRLRRYRMISDVETKGEEAPYHLGVIIDELEQVSPGLVIESPVMEKREVTDEDGNVTTEQVQVDTVKGWKTSIVHLKALKALQEAMARIEALEARLEALEA